MKFLSYCLLAGLGAGTAHAQTTFSIGPRLGGNLSMATYTGIDRLSPSSKDYSYSRSSLLGYQVGLTASIGGSHVAFQPSLLFSTKGLKQVGTAAGNSGGVQYSSSLTTTTRVSYLEVPLNVVYSLGEQGQGFQVFAGPYVAFVVGGSTDHSLVGNATGPGVNYNQTYTGSEDNQTGDVFVDPDPKGTSSTPKLDARTRSFDAGLNIGVGYRVGPVQAQLGYGLGLVNTQPDYPTSYKEPNVTGYNRLVQLSLSYLFAVGGR